MNPPPPAWLGPAGLLVAGLGAVLLLAEGRARFRRRNPHGLLRFHTYGGWLAFRAGSAALRTLGRLLLIAGGLLLLLQIPPYTPPETVRLPGVTPAERAGVPSGE